VRVVNEWHLDRGWDGIGYHYVITKTYMGRIWFGRSIAKMGAHTLGKNRGSIGICVTGRSKFTKAQYNSLISLLNHLMDLFDLTIDDIHPHNEFNKNKTCPNFNLEPIKEALWLMRQ
jgi:N-acetyl-anhydromuramyl-L-alanine amidase AmpD